MAVIDLVKSSPVQLVRKQPVILLMKFLSWHKHLVLLGGHEVEVLPKQGRAQPRKREVSRPVQTSGAAARRTRIAGLPSLKKWCRGGGKSSREHKKDGGEMHGVQRVGKAWGSEGEWRSFCKGKTREK